jgi:hypothetical protein
VVHFDPETLQPIGAPITVGVTPNILEVGPGK